MSQSPAKPPLLRNEAPLTSASRELVPGFAPPPARWIGTSPESPHRSSRILPRGEYRRLGTRRRSRRNLTRASRSSGQGTPGSAARPSAGPTEAPTRHRLEAQHGRSVHIPPSAHSRSGGSGGLWVRTNSGPDHPRRRFCRLSCRGSWSRRPACRLRRSAGAWMRRVGLMRRMRLVRMVVRPSGRGGRCRARAGRSRARAGRRSGLRGGCCRRFGRGRSGRTGRASCGCTGMLVRGAPATSRGGSWPGGGYLSRAWSGAVALRRSPVIAGGGNRARERGGASTRISGEIDPCDGLTERDGPGHHGGCGHGGWQGGP